MPIDNLRKKLSNSLCELFFRRIPIFTRVLERRKTKKVTISDDFSLLVAGEPQISNFLEGYEMVVDLWKYLNRRHE